VHVWTSPGRMSGQSAKQDCECWSCCCCCCCKCWIDVCSVVGDVDVVACVDNVNIWGVLDVVVLVDWSFISMLVLLL